MKRHTLDKYPLQTAILLTVLTACIATRVCGVSATGGTVTNYVQNGTNWAAHIFTSNGTLTVINDGQIEYLIVGGGGGGGAVYQGGGGGAGGFLTGAAHVSAGSLSIRVGTGGLGVRQPGGPSNGGDSAISNSVLGVILAAGGGSGGGEGAAATSGGSGGGGAHGAGQTVPGKGIENPPPRQGYDGGAGGNCDAGGGGGAGGPGKTPGEGRAGGPGRTSFLRDGVTEVTYATGGNGHGRDGTDGVSKAANTGDGGDGGGVGGGGVGGNGGSGIVILRYRSFAMGNEPVTDVTPTHATFNGWLFSTGGEAASVGILWGEANGGNSWDWAQTEWFEGTQWTNNTPFGKKMAGLVKDKTYYYTFGAKNTSSKTLAAPPVSFITGEVTLKAAQAQAHEKGPAGVPVPAVVTVSRPAACSEAPLTVAYAVSGTASNGADYTLLAGTVTLPANAASADIVIAPWNDMRVEGAETVTLTLLPGPYIVGAANAATVTIADTVVRAFYVSPQASPTPPYDTWTTGFSSLQAALSHPDTQADALIHLPGGVTFTGPARGEAHPDNTVFRWNRANNVMLLGGYRADLKLPRAEHPGPRAAGQTVLRRGTDVRIRVLTMIGVSNAVIEQITIRDGRVGGNRALGGGLFLADCANVTIRDCKIVSNACDHDSVGLGGGMYLAGSQVALSDTAIAANAVDGPDSYGGGVYVHRDSRLTVTRSTIEGNRAVSATGGMTQGGGFYVVPGGDLEIENTGISGNTP